MPPKRNRSNNPLRNKDYTLTLCLEMIHQVNRNSGISFTGFQSSFKNVDGNRNEKRFT